MKIDICNIFTIYFPSLKYKDYIYIFFYYTEKYTKLDNNCSTDNLGIFLSIWSFEIFLYFYGNNWLRVILQGWL